MQEKALHEQDATVCENYLPLGNTHRVEMLEEAPSLLAGPAISTPPSSACKYYFAFQGMQSIRRTVVLVEGKHRQRTKKEVRD